jgi:hypothetical protein
MEEYINAGCIHMEGRINTEAMDGPTMDILCMLIHCDRGQGLLGIYG